MSLEEERLLGRSDLGWIDPDRRGRRRWLRCTTRESFRMCGVRCRQDLGTGHEARLCQTVVDVVGREQAEAGVAVLGVVPGEKDLAVRASILDRAEALREVRPVFQRLELRLRERVVVR